MARDTHHDTHTPDHSREGHAISYACKLESVHCLGTSTAPSDLRDRFRIGAFTNECAGLSEYRAMAGNSTQRV